MHFDKKKIKKIRNYQSQSNESVPTRSLVSQLLIDLYTTKRKLKIALISSYMYLLPKKVSANNQEIPQPHIVDQHTTPRGKATDQ